MTMARVIISADGSWSVLVPDGPDGRIYSGPDIESLLAHELFADLDDDGRAYWRELHRQGRQRSADNDAWCEAWARDHSIPLPPWAFGEQG